MTTPHKSGDSLTSHSHKTNKGPCRLTASQKERVILPVCMYYCLSRGHVGLCWFLYSPVREFFHPLPQRSHWSHLKRSSKLPLEGTDCIYVTGGRNTLHLHWQKQHHIWKSWYFSNRHVFPAHTVKTLLFVTWQIVDQRRMLLWLKSGQATWVQIVAGKYSQ